MRTLYRVSTSGAAEKNDVQIELSLERSSKAQFIHDFSILMLSGVKRLDSIASRKGLPL